MTGLMFRSCRRGRRLAAGLVVVLGYTVWSSPAPSAAQARAHQMAMPASAAGSPCDEPSLACATAATPYFGPDGTLWLTWAAAGQVSVAHSSDLGRSFSPAVRVTPAPLTLDNGPDARPQILVDHHGRIVVGYSIFKDENYNGQIFLAESGDGGTTFTRPHPLTAGTASQRFLTLALGPDDRVLGLWIDKRHVVAAARAGRPFEGASVAFAWSADGGAHFAPATIIQDHSCECCRLALALEDGHPIVLFRNVFAGSERDHAVITFTGPSTPGPVYRVSLDHWVTDACPITGRAWPSRVRAPTMPCGSPTAPPGRGRSTLARPTRAGRFHPPHRSGTRPAIRRGRTSSRLRDMSGSPGRSSTASGRPCASWRRTTTEPPGLHRVSLAARRTTPIIRYSSATAITRTSRG